MPCDYSRYPKNWREIRSRILKRAGNGCECLGDCGDTHLCSVSFPNENVHSFQRCFAPNGVFIVRHDYEPERWMRSDDVINLLHAHGEQAIAGYEFRKPVKVVLTLAHLDRDPSNDDETRIRAFCQRCHLKYDAKQHAESARVTRMARKAVGNLRGIT